MKQASPKHAAILTTQASLQWHLHFSSPIAFSFKRAQYAEAQGDGQQGVALSLPQCAYEVRRSLRSRVCGRRGFKRGSLHESLPRPNAKSSWMDP
eukprot:32037-Pelagomonas_calceolata.AAC.4